MKKDFGSLISDLQKEQAERQRYTRQIENKSLSELDKLAATLICRDLQEAGSLQENNWQLEIVNGEIVGKMHYDFGGCWLWQVNAHNPDDIVKEHHPDSADFWGASFVTPTYDAELERLIKLRLAAPYLGTDVDRVAVNQVFNRMEEIGGISLLWS